jgi:hypothetical protein
MEKTLKTNTLCWYPFNQVAAMAWTKKSGPVSVLPCCNMSDPANMDPMKLVKYLKEVDGNFTPDDIFYGKEFTELRESMIRGEKHPACNICWKEEETSKFSKRLSNPNWNDEIDIDNPSIKSIDAKMDEHCNLRCRMCNPNSSNKLRIDQTYFHNNNMSYMINENKMWGWEITDKQPLNSNPNDIIHFNEDNLFYKSLITQKNLIKIKASGGEPMMSDFWKNWIDEILKDKEYASKMEILVHTNATKFTDENIERLLQFKKITALCSIDATDKCYEYIRYPMTWDALNNSLTKFIKVIPAEKLQLLQLSSVFSIYSAFDIENFVNWSINMFKISNTNQLSLWFDHVYPFDGNLSVKWLPNELLLELVDVIEKSIILIKNTPDVHSNLEGLVLNIKKYLTIDKPLQNQLEIKREIIAFDLVRGQSYANHLDIRLVEWLDTLDHTSLT